ncbi:MAG: tetratricopeptide repeat protein [Anaerolineales bacterium]|jgi:tetratricopeptide (TPR) repeat protein
MADDRMFIEAKNAINAGQRARARDLLTRLLRAEQNNVEYWLYMSTVVDTKKEQVYCLENVLKYDANNETAARGLILLGEMPPDETVTPIRPVREREWNIEKVYEGEEVEGLTPSKPPRTALPPAQALSLGIALLIVAAFLVFGLTGNPFFMGIGQSRVSNNVSYQPLFTSGPTSTAYLTETAEAIIAAGGIIPTPTQLSFSVDVSYTPTPRYVDTPHPDDMVFNQAMQAFDQRNYSQAIALFDQFIEDEPTAMDAKYYRGLAYLGNEEYEAARDEFLRIIDRDESFAPAYVGLAEAWLGINPDWVVGDELYTAVSLAPDFIEGHLARAEYRLNRNIPNGVINDAKAVLDINPENGMAYYYLASAYLLQEENEEALEAAYKAQELDATILESYFILAQAMAANDMLVEALSPLQTYLTYEKENGEAWFLSGRGKQAAGNHNGALEDFTTALKLRPDLYEINYYRGLSYMAVGNIENALDRLKVSGQHFPKWFDAQVALTDAYYQSGEYKAANQTIVDARSSAKTDEQLAVFYYWRALTFEMMGFSEQAEMDWNALLELPSLTTPQNLAVEAARHLQELKETPAAPVPTPTRYSTWTPTP